MLSFLFIASYAETITGDCGENVKYSFDRDNCKLTISGSGPMADYSFPPPPWTEYSDSIESAVIDEGVTTIGAFAFSHCNHLNSITIPESAKSIGHSVFDICTSLTSINVSPNNKAFKLNEGVLFNYNKNELLCYPAGKWMNRYFIPFGVEIIGDFAFSSCKYLSSITIPTSVTEIGSFAFEYCEGLSSIIIPQSINTLSYYAFRDCSNLLSVTHLGATDFKNNDILFLWIDINQYSRKCHLYWLWCIW